MTITLPDEMREVLEARAKAHGFSSVDEYVRDTVEMDDDEPLELTDAMRDRLIELAEAGLKSGPAVEGEAFLSELEQRVRAGQSVADLHR